jgi:peroxiredoxin
MERLTSGVSAPDFELTDTNGNKVKLSDFRSKQKVVLVLMRGFV